MKEPHSLTRKDIARILNISVYQVGRNEKRLGLDRARFDINSRVIRYRELDALRILKVST